MPTAQKDCVKKERIAFMVETCGDAFFTADRTANISGFLHGALGGAKWLHVKLPVTDAEHDELLNAQGPKGKGARVSQKPMPAPPTAGQNGEKAKLPAGYLQTKGDKSGTALPAVFAGKCRRLYNRKTIVLEGQRRNPPDAPLGKQKFAFEGRRHTRLSDVLERVRGEVLAALNRSFRENVVGLDASGTGCILFQGESELAKKWRAWREATKTREAARATAVFHKHSYGAEESALEVENDLGFDLNGSEGFFSAVPCKNASGEETLKLQLNPTLVKGRRWAGEA